MRNARPEEHIKARRGQVEFSRHWQCEETNIHNQKAMALRSGDVDGADVYGNGSCIVDICLIAEQTEIPMRVERGVLSII